MRWSELFGKEIIDIDDANRLGRVDQADLVVASDGTIQALVAGTRGGRRARGGLSIPWDRVVRIGREAMLVSAQGIDRTRPGRAPGRRGRRVDSDTRGRPFEAPLEDVVAPERAAPAPRRRAEGEEDALRTPAPVPVVRVLPRPQEWTGGPGDDEPARDGEP